MRITELIASVAAMVIGTGILAKIFPNAIAWVFERLPRHFKPREGAAGMDDVMLRAVDVFGGRPQAQAWLDRPNRALSGAAPQSLLATPEGRERVLTILGRIEHGIYS